LNINTKQHAAIFITTQLLFIHTQNAWKLRHWLTYELLFPDLDVVHSKSYSDSGFGLMKPRMTSRQSCIKACICIN